MHGMMMNVPLLVSSILNHAVANHGETEIVSRATEGGIHKYTYFDLERRSKKLANALHGMGLKSGDRVGTLAWNGYRHMELYYGVSCSGFICHTINPRLFHDQIAYIVNHADDSVIFVDLTFVPILEAIAPKIASVKAIVVLTDEANMPRSAILPNLLCYEDLIAPESDAFDWPDLDENTASGLCYTSGTTSAPKGVLYSHRSSVLHALTSCLPEVFGFTACDVITPIVPMFHVNAWGIPFSALIVGAKLVMPGANLDGASLHSLFESEGVTIAGGVPTVWMTLLDWVDANAQSFSTLQRIAVGGSAPSLDIINRFHSRSIMVRHAWGMTETSPIGLVSAKLPKHRNLSSEKQALNLTKQGRPIYGVEIRVNDADGQPITHDGKAMGNLLVRGPWVASGYFNSGQNSTYEDNAWFDTNDVVTVDEDNIVQIVDRTKDLIKSGGEWISSIELENIAQAHPSIIEAAVVARPDQRWGERPVLVVQLQPDAMFTHDDMISLYSGKVGRWCVPDEVIIVDELPHNATGKLLKSAIRELVTP
ncbi:long-chain-fatty-acid--CoA ligase [Bradyrhizobium sp.]|uniref:long-chain-fatty-acid--CoA ligase n=1 Tax=Bradyrhizobium sp. TaxID=376 RepID=UPI0039E4372F